MAVTQYKSCEVCGEVREKVKMAEVAIGTFCCHGCKGDWEGPRGRTESGALII